MQAIKLQTIDEINIDESRKHLTNLHKGSEGYITVASKAPGYSQWHYKREDLLERTEDIINDINAYVSQNTFYRPQRRIENIKELRAIYIDIDCYNSKYTKEAVKYFLENDLYGSKIPVPNYLIDSGRGLYYVILIKPAPSMALPLWYAVQRYLFNVLKPFGADANALDPTRVLRIVGTLNSKSGTCVEVLDANDYEYSLKEIQEEYLPEISEEALRRALELNSMFKKPLPENEVIQDTKSATRAYENRLYKYTNTKLIEILDITLDEQQHLVTIISGKEKYRRSAEEQKAKKKAKRRNENGLTKKQQELQDLKIKIEELKQQGLSNRKIAS